MVNIITSKTLEKIARETQNLDHMARLGKHSRRDFLRICGVAGISAGIGTLTGCSKPSNNEPPPPPPPPGKETLAGKITDVLSNSAVSGATIACSEDSGTSDANGNYSIQYTQGTTPILTITHSSFFTRTTFPQYGPNYSVIPNSFNMAEFNTICRSRNSGTVRWSLDAGKKPIVYITTDNDPPYKNPPKYFKDLVRDIVKNDFPRITNNTLKILTVEEGSRTNAPSTDVIIVNYILLGGAAGTELRVDGTNSINYASVEMLVLDAQGQEMNVPRERLIHELGHTIGFEGIIDNRNSIMFRSPGVGYSPTEPTQLDIDNGTVLYSRPTMNKDPDNDPTPPDAVFSYQTYQDAINQEAGSFFDPLDTDRMTRGLRTPEAWIRHEQRMREIQMRQRRELEAYERANRVKK